MANPGQMSNLQYALMLGRMGYKSIPLCPPDADGHCGCGRGHNEKEVGKAPLTKTGVKAATAEAPTISRLWADVPNANVGIDLTGLIMVDPDSEDAQLEAEELGLPPTLKRLSRFDAYLYKAPEGLPPVRQIHKGHCRAIDILAGGYMVAYGTHRTGCRVELQDLDVEPADPPQWVLDMLYEAAEQAEKVAADIEATKVETANQPTVRLRSTAMKWWTGEKFSESPNGIDRSATLYMIGLALASANASTGMIVDALAERDVTLGYNKYSGRKDAATQYMTIAHKAIAAQSHSMEPYTNGSSPASAPENEIEERVVPWPKPMAETAFIGLAGDVVKAIYPRTEASREALLLNFLTFFGNAIGGTVFAKAEADKHSTNFNVVLVGPTSKGRKGTSMGHIKELFSRADPFWSEGCIAGGLSSGEGLITAVRDEITKVEPIKEKGKSTGEFETVVVDPGVSDKRLLVIEPEFASVIHQMARETNTLSAIIRQAWDSLLVLRIMTRRSPVQATGAHVSILGHITIAELLKYLTQTETANGFANRFLWCCTKRSKILPDGGGTPDYKPLVERLTKALREAESPRHIFRDAEASAMWAEIYEELSEGKPGMLGGITSRAEAQVLRLSVVYAALDSSPAIGVDHLCAALAVWNYCESSAAHIFGDKTGDALADRLLDILTQGPMDRTGLTRATGNNLSAKKITDALEMLQKIGQVQAEHIEGTGNKPREIWSIAEKM
jgi:hypothetical protein